MRLTLTKREHAAKFLAESAGRFFTVAFRICCEHVTSAQRHLPTELNVALSEVVYLAPHGLPAS